MKKYLCLAVFLSLWALPAAALPDNDSNNTLTYDGQTVAGLEPIVAGHGQQNADGNTVTVSNSTIQDNNSPLHNAQVVGGWAVSGTANQNRVEITDSTVNRNIVGGQSTFGTQANGNIINITQSKVNEGAALQDMTTLSSYQAEHRYDDQGNGIYVLSSMVSDSVKTAGDIAPESSLYTTHGGIVANGEASGNQISVSGNGSVIGNNLMGAYSPYLKETHLHDNSVTVTNAQVTGLITGAGSLGANWNTTIQDPLTVNNNTITVTSSQINDAIGAYGGLATNGNRITLVGSSADNLYGVSFGQDIFYSGAQPDTIENTANNNSVLLYNNSSATGNIYGAQSHSVQAYGNQVVLARGSSAQGSIYGAHISNARVQTSDTTVDWNTVQTAAENNTLSLSGSTAGNASAHLAAAKNFSGWANNNTVDITDSTVTAAILAGGWAEHERQTLTAEGQQNLSIGYQADGNIVSSAESQLSGAVYGGLVSTKDDTNPDGVTDDTLSSASSNLVHLDTSTLTGNVYGGAAQGDYTSANQNRVWLTDTQVTGSVYGALAEGTHSSAAQNEVILQNSTVTGDVYAASATQGGSNTVTLSGQSRVDGTVYGGNGGNNQLTLLNFQSDQALNVSGFDKPYIISGADTSVIFAQDVAQGEVYVQGVDAVDGRVIIQTPDENSSFTLHAADSGVYTYSLTPQAQSSGLTGWLLSGGFSSARAKTYAQTGMAALALANAGDNLLTDAVSAAWQNDQESGSFLQSGYEETRHETGSGVHLNATTVLGGLYAKTGNWLGGFYARYAYGDYHTYPVRAESYASSWAGGIFGAWNGVENLRLGADARVGWQETSYGGSAETGASFDYESVFTSLQASAQYDFWQDMQAEARLRWTHIQGDSLTDNLGEAVSLHASDSLLSTVGVTYAPRALAFSYFTPEMKVQWLNEFNGKGSADVEGHRIDGLSLRGSTGRVSLGLSYQRPDQGLLARLAGFVQGGQMDGWGLKLDAALRF